MTQLLYPLSRGAINLLVFILLSSLSSYIHAQNGTVTTTQSFSYTGQIVTWTVPTGVTSLTIEARGAEGGDLIDKRVSAGKGAIVAAQVSVTSGQSLSVLVGQDLSGRAAGGGGSFVVGPGNGTTPTPLVIAAGGGGAGYVGESNAKHGQTGTSGGNNGGGAGGTNGAGGSGSGGGGGGGFISDGGGTTNSSNSGGRAFINGGAGGRDFNNGSFGGGGGGSFGSGGGGGYSGGGGGSGGGSGGGVGGGGGSFTAGTRLFDRSGATDGNSGNGLVIISYNQCSPFTVNLRNDGPLTCAKKSVLLTTTGAPAGASYTYSFGAQASSTSSTTATVTNSGPYSVTVTVPGGCSATATTIISSNTTAPGVSINPTNQAVCQGQTATFTATGADSYTWNTGATTASISVVANASNVYSVRGTSTGNGCSATASATLSVNALPPATLSASPSTVLSCSQTSLTLTAGSGTSYTFSGPGVVSQQGNQAVINAPGTYSVTVTSSGCSNTAQLVISQDNTAPLASLASSGTLSCNVTSVTLTASPGGQAYRFSNGASQLGTTNQATVTTAGIYSVTVSSGNGCSSVASTTVTGDQTPPTVSISPTSGSLTCASPTLTLTANTTAPILRWSTGQTTLSITVNAAGTYSVTATGSNGCSATSNSVLIESSQSAPPATLVASGALSCAVSSVTLTANTGSGLSYRFSSGATQVGNGNTATVNTAGTYSVTVTSTATGCTNTASVVVNQDNSQPTLSVSPTTATLTCANPMVMLTANTAASSLTWSTGQTTASISVSVAGTYSVSVMSANGCMAMAQATVSGTTDAPTAPTLSASPSTTTTNQPIVITATGCTGGTINWALSGGSGQAGPTSFTLTQPGNYSLSASCSLNGCTSAYSPLLALQIRPGGFAITGVNMVNCQLTNPARGEYQVQFTPQYTGQNGNQITFSVVNELAATTAPAPYSLRLYTDNPVITLVANQAGNGAARFAYNWLASCQSGTSPNQPPTTTGIPSQTIVQRQGYQLQLTSYFSDPDGQALTFQASGLPAGLTLGGSVISGTPSQTGVSSVNVTAIDPGGLQVSTKFQLTVNPMPVTPPTGFAIVGVSTVSCQVLSAGERRLTFTPQYAGVSGQPISFSVVNELVATTNPGPYSLNLYTDNPAITLSAQQGASVSTYRYNWLAVCTPAARVGSGEAGSSLTVRVLGNPVAGNTVEVEISGVAGQAMQLNLMDLQGKSVHTHRIEQANAVERVSLPLGASNGVLLLHVSTPTQHQQVKLLRTI